MDPELSTISLVVLAKFNPAQYQVLINSAVAFVQEIICLVDNGAEKGISGYRPTWVRYIRHPMLDDFSYQRNFGQAQVTKEWILFLDTDENLTPWLWNHIAVIADSTTEESISFPFHNKVEGHEDYWAWPDYHVRMYRPSPQIKWTRPAHPLLMGIKSERRLPMKERYAVQHVKTREMQDRSDAYNVKRGWKG